MRYASNIMEAEEITHDTFLIVFQKIDALTDLESVKSWIRRIAINKSIDYYRKDVKHRQMTDIESVQQASTAENILDQLSSEEIMDCVQQLSPSYRTVFNLYVVEGYKHKEIAEMLQIKESTSKSNLTRAKEKLTEMLQKIRS